VARIFEFVVVLAQRHLLLCAMAFKMVMSNLLYHMLTHPFHLDDFARGPISVGFAIIKPSQSCSMFSSCTCPKSERRFMNERRFHQQQSRFFAIVDRCFLLFVAAFRYEWVARGDYEWRAGLH
jgi:hypothetical protein